MHARASHAHLMAERVNRVNELLHMTRFTTGLLLLTVTCRWRAAGTRCHSARLRHRHFRGAWVKGWVQHQWWTGPTSACCKSQRRRLPLLLSPALLPALLLLLLLLLLPPPLLPPPLPLRPRR